MYRVKKPRLPNVRTVDAAMRERYENGKTTAHEVAVELYRAGWTFYVFDDKAALERIGIGT